MFRHLLIITPLLLSSCYLSQTYKTVSEVGRSHDLASLPTHPKQTVWKKNGYYYARASLGRYNKTFKYGEYVTSLPYSNQCKYEQQSGSAYVNGYLELTQSQFDALVNNPTGKKRGSNMLFTWLPSDDFTESKEYELPEKYAIDHALISCNTFSRDNTYRVGIHDEWYYPLMQRIAVLDAIFIDLPVSIVVSPAYWIYSGTNDDTGEKKN